MIELLEFECPISFYLFDSFNNTLNVTVVGDNSTTTQSYTIPVGNYDTSTLLTQLNALFTAASTPYTITTTYNATTLKFKFVVAPASPNTAITSFSLNSTSTCLKILGFHDTLSVNGTILISDGVANLNRTSNIYIKTPDIRLQNLNSKGEFDNTLAKCHVTKDAGEFIHYQQANSDAKFILNNNYLDRITVVLEDDDGNSTSSSLSTLTSSGSTFTSPFSCAISASRAASCASSSATLVRSAATSFSISAILRARIRSEIFAIECDVMSPGVFFIQISQNFFIFFDQSQSEKIVRKMRIEFCYASE